MRRAGSQAGEAEHAEPDRMARRPAAQAGAARESGSKRRGRLVHVLHERKRSQAASTAPSPSMTHRHEALRQRGRLARTCGQCRISIRPSKCSTTAVQLSTQSPVLMYCDVAEVLDRRMMDVAADHAVDLGAPRLLGQHVLERADEVDRLLDLHLGPGRERPVGQAEQPAHPRHQPVDAAWPAS